MSNVRSIRLVDFLSIVVIVCVGILLLISPIHAVISDFWYHLAVTRAYLTESAIPTHDWWSFQPIGRPHFYPPLLHMLIGFVSGSVDHLIERGYQLGSVLYVASLTTWWVCYRYFWGPVLALIATAVLTTNMIFLLTATSLMPAALVTLLLPLMLIGIDRKEGTGTTVLLVLSIYSHLVLPWLILLGMLISQWRAHRRWAYGVTGVTIALSFPLILYVAQSMGTSLTNAVTSDINPLPGIGPFAIFSHHIFNVIWILLVVFGIWHTRRETGDGIRLVRIFCLALLPALLFYGGRYFWHAAPLLTVFAVLPFKKHIDSFFAQLSWEKGYVILALCSILLIPTISISIHAKRDTAFSIDPAWTALDLALIPTENVTDTPEFSKMIQYITAHASSAYVLSVDDPEMADIIFVTTGIPTNNGQFWESFDYTQRDDSSYKLYIHRFTPFPEGIDIVQNFGEYRVGFRD